MQQQSAAILTCINGTHVLNSHKLFGVKISFVLQFVGGGSVLRPFIAHHKFCEIL